jgi:hypothetical protein
MRKSEFDRILSKIFLDLEGRHGFKRGAPVYDRNGCTVELTNPTTNVTLHYRIGEEPWFSIADARDAENQSTLEWLLVEKGIKKPPTAAQAFQTLRLPDGDIESVLAAKCHQLIEHGEDLLRGDFSLMPRLRERARKYAVECARYSALHKDKQARSKE